MWKIRSLVVGLSLALACGAIDDVEAKKKKKSKTKMFDPKALCDKTYASGLEFKKNSRFPDAKEAFIGTIEACPDYRKAFVQLGNISNQMKEYDEAIDHFEKALDLEGDDVGVTESLAWAYSASGNLEKAEDIYVGILREHPDRMSSAQNLAFTYEQQGKAVEAFMLYNMSFEAEMTNNSIEEKIANVALSMKQYEQAYVFTKRQLDRDPEKLDLRRKMAYFHYKMQDWDGAVERYTELVGISEGTDAGLADRQILAYCLSKAERMKEAFPHYDFIIDNDETPEENTFFLYGNALVDDGQFLKAIGVGQKGLLKNGSWHCVQYMIGEAYSKRGDFLQEQEQFDKSRAAFKTAKSEFAKVLEGRCSENAISQLKRQDQLINRLNKIQEKAGY